MSRSWVAPVHVGRDGKRMILIPAGWFMMGTSEQDIVEMGEVYAWKRHWFSDEAPQHRVYLDAYYIDETPVTNADYKRFVDANPYHAVPLDWGHSSRMYRAGKANHPVIGISYADAEAYAFWAGKRLPTEAEWEKAARGVDGRRFPWGDTFHPARCNCKKSAIDTTTPVTQYASLGESPYGVLDMAGNVWEWCSDWYDAKFYSESPTRNPKGAVESDWRVLRGGAWDTTPDYVRCASRDYLVPEDTGSLTVGFRCVTEVQ